MTTVLSRKEPKSVFFQDNILNYFEFYLEFPAF